MGIWILTLNNFPVFFIDRSSRPEVFCKKGVLRNFAKFTEKHSCQSLKKEALAQVFFCEFCEISKNNFPYRTPPVVASILATVLLHLNFFMTEATIIYKPAHWFEISIDLSRANQWPGFFYMVETSFIKELHCVNSALIGSFCGPYFPAFGLYTERYWMREKIRILKHPNARKYGSEKLRIWTLFTQR